MKKQKHEFRCKKFQLGSPRLPTRNAGPASSWEGKVTFGQEPDFISDVKATNENKYIRGWIKAVCVVFKWISLGDWHLHCCLIPYTLGNNLLERHGRIIPSGISQDSSTEVFITALTWKFFCKHWQKGKQCIYTTPKTFELTSSMDKKA